MSESQILFHKMKKIVGYIVAIVLIVFALFVSGVRLLLTTANVYHDEVEQLASTIIKQPVKIESLNARLSGLQPVLEFNNVEISDAKTKKPVFTLAKVDVGLSLRAFILNQQLVPSYFVVKGLQVDVRKRVNGDIVIDNVDVDAIAGATTKDKSSNFIQQILKYSDLAIQDSEITWHDEQHSRKWAFKDVNIALRNELQRHQLSVKVNLPDMLGKTISLDADFEGDLQAIDDSNGKFFLHAKELDITRISKYLPGMGFEIYQGHSDAKIWANWSRGNIQALHGDASVTHLDLGQSKKTSVKIDYLKTNFKINRDKNKNWLMALNKVYVITEGKEWPKTSLSIALNKTENKLTSVKLSSGFMRLKTISQLATETGFLKLTDSDFLKKAQFRGDVKNLDLDWEEQRVSNFDMEFADVEMQGWNKIPSLTGLTGKVSLKNDTGNFHVVSENFSLDAPALFRNKITTNNLQAEAKIFRSKEGWLIEVEKLLAVNPDAKTLTSAKIYIPLVDQNKSPHFDIQTKIKNLNASAISKYYPAGIMDKNLVSWLDKSIVKGKISNASFIFNGSYKSFPYKNNEGHLSVTFDVDDFELDYYEGWPRLENSKANIRITNKGLIVDVLSGETSNNVISDAHISVPDFSMPVLGLSLLAKGELNNTSDFIVNSPILPGAKSVISDMTLSGAVETRVLLSLPLSKEIKTSTKYSGTADFTNASVYMLNNKIDIKNLGGKFVFSTNDYGSKNLTAVILGEKTRLKVTSENNNLVVSSSGKMNPGDILKRFDVPGARQYTGTCKWNGRMVFPLKNSNEKWPVLYAESDLYGVASELPDYFAKTKTEKTSMIFSYGFMPERVGQIGLKLGQRYHAMLNIDNKKSKPGLIKGAVSFSELPAILPVDNVLTLSGDIGKLSLSEWVTALDLNKGKNKQTFFVNPVVLNLGKLNIITDDKNENTSTNPPAHYPLVKGLVNNLYYNDIPVGKIDFSTSRRSTGIHFDEFIVVAPHFKLVGEGDWRYKNNQHKTMLDLTLSSNDFGSMLRDLGFAAIIDEGEMMTIGKVSWDAAPHQFSLSKLNGNLQLKVDDGTINEVDPGAGRLLGLFSLAALPRKLIGDFKGIFKSGFGFDTAFGEVEIDEGDAYSDNFHIVSPVADITLNGRMGLDTRDYDQRLLVVPEVGSTVSGVVALLVNLPAGIGLWLVDKLTGEQLNEGSTREYEITGSWDSPVITEIRKSAQ